MKLTRDQLQSRKDKAVRFVEDVLDDPDRAAEIEDESLEDYADRRHIELTNPKRRMSKMATTRNTDKDRIDELEAENEALRESLDTIASIAGGDDEEDEDEDEDDSDPE